MACAHAKRRRSSRSSTPSSRLRVKSLVAQRGEARKAKNFKEADRIRDELAAMGVASEGLPRIRQTGEIVTTWELAR